MEMPTGLFQFPVTKLCMISTGAVALAASVSNCKYLFIAKYDPFISQYHQYYRLAIFQLGCINETDVALIILIWYQFRSLERLMGSYKYLSILSLAFIYTTFSLAGLNILLNKLLPWKIWNSLSTGSLPLVLSMFHFFKEYTPEIYQFQVLLAQPWSKKANKKQHVWHLNDQFLVNTLIALLLLNQGLVGITCGFISWLCGVFIDKGLFPGIERWRLPLVKKFFTHDSHASRDVARDNYRESSDVGEEINAPIRRYDTAEAGNTNSDALPLDDENANDEPQRSLGVQFLDTFRR